MYISNFRLFASVLSTSCMLSTLVLAADSSASSDPNAPVTRSQLPGLVKEILLNDPSIIMEAAEKMQAEQEKEMMDKAKEVIAKRKDELFGVNDPSAGNQKADVTLVEFFDYHCGYCKQALASIIKLMENDKNVKVIFKEYPILGEESKLAAKAALAVHRIAKDKYFDYHKAIFALKGSFTQEILAAEAKKLGIDAAKLKAEMDKPEINEILAKNSELGLAMGARGTPAIVIGEEFYPGAIPYEAMKKAVDDIRAKKK